MKIGVFIPIGSRGWLISTTSPKTMPSYDLNRAMVQRAEFYGLDFALSMVKLRGYDGPSEYWVHNLESFTLMAGIAAVTRQHPALRLRGGADHAPGAGRPHGDDHRFHRAGSVRRQYRDRLATQGIPADGALAWRRRISLADTTMSSEYVHIMRELWTSGRSDFKGDFFQMDDCVLSPRPSHPIPIVGAGQSDRGMRFVAEYGDFNFVGAPGLNDTKGAAEVVARVRTAVSAGRVATSARCSC